MGVTGRKKRVILLVAEAVTLAHYGRIATLARALPAADYEVVVAADPRYRALDEIAGIGAETLWSIPYSQFARALERGQPLYDAGTLMRYVEDDLALIDRVRPDLVVGDFRLSLAVSAPLSKVPYASVVNAYWSPYAEVDYPVPDLPFTRFTGLGLGQRLFNLARPLAFRLHARPLQQARRHFGLPPLAGDLRSAYSWGDATLYADIPEVVPARALPAHHRYLGAVLWSSRTSLPDWWHALPTDRPVVFVTLGSSGHAERLPEIVEALSRLPVTVMAATAGKIVLPAASSNCRVADYLPIEAAVRRSALVICNGGSLTTYQALAHGVPALGVCSNMDQLLNMQALQKQGAGMLLRAAGASGEAISRAAAGMLAQEAFGRAARRLATELARYDAADRFRGAVADMLGV